MTTKLSVQTSLPELIEKLRKQLAETEDGFTQSEALLAMEIIEKLDLALIAIAEHSHCECEPANGCIHDHVLSHYMSEHNLSDWWIGCVEGHRCAAEIARKARS